ncbi:MAG: STAS domain-containing protein [Acidobacteria bacterium]|nr:STAS domain-containing protein [Acidobacteriota bacterium]
MAYPIERREKGGVTILAPQGRLVLGEPVQALRLAFEDLSKEGKVRIVLDMREVDYIDSSALGCLVMAHTRVEQAGGALPIFGLQRRTVELLVITKLSTVFRLAETESDAINLCYPERATNQFDILSFVEEQRKKDGGA